MSFYFGSSLFFRQRFALLAALSVALAMPVAAFATPYPIADPYLATLTARLLAPTGAGPESVIVPALPGRNSAALLSGRLDLDVSAYIQSGPAPLVFIIPGLGGTSSDSMALWLAQRWQEEGYSALVVWSPLSWKFVAGQSSTAIFGNSRADSADLYRVLQEAKAAAEKTLGLQATSTAICGYSLGAIDAAFVHDLDRREGRLQISKAVLLNPPLDLQYASKTLDDLSALGAGFSAAEKNSIWGQAMSAGQQILEAPLSPEAAQAILSKPLPLTHREAQWLIGDSARQSLTAAIFASQQINDIGLLGAKATWGSRNLREAAAAKFGYLDWQNKAALPFWEKQNGESSDVTLKNSDWSAIQSAVVADHGSYVIHSLDDPLSRADDERTLAAAMGGRATLLPFGGHCGAYWHPQFLEALKNSIRAKTI